MTNLRITWDKVTQRHWPIYAIGKLQRLSEKLFLVGLAIAFRNKLERYAIYCEAHVDTEVHRRISSRSITHNLVLFFRPSSRI
jgi:hypothetical protein